MKSILIALRLLLGGVFIFSALSKLFPIEVFELNFVYQGIADWQLAPYLSRGLICIELFLGLCLLFNSLLKEVILPATLLLLLAFSIYLGYTLMKEGNSGNCGCFGTVLPMTPLESLIKNFVLIGLVLFLYTKTQKTGWKYKFLHPSLFVLSTAPIVLLFPIYDYSYAPKKLKGELVEIADITNFKGEANVNLKEGKKLVAVFNMACSHCIEVALKISAAKSRVELPPTYYLLMGDSSEVKEFYDLTNSSAPYVLMNAVEFIKKYRSGWPRVYLLENGIIRYDNDYQSFNGEDFEKTVRNFIRLNK